LGKGNFTPTPEKVLVFVSSPFSLLPGTHLPFTNVPSSAKSIAAKGNFPGVAGVKNISIPLPATINSSGEILIMMAPAIPLFTGHVCSFASIL